ncbi:MAG: hypothetical protein ABSF62_15075 [Bryobacteraceae bacterium]
MDDSPMLLGVFSLWVAIAVLAYLVVRRLGWARVKQRWLAALVPAFLLAGLPGAAVLTITLPYRARILALVFRTKSPALDLGNGCSVFPANNIWNTPVAGLPVDPHSAAYIESMGAGLPLHADFSTASGIPYSVTGGNQAASLVTYGDGAAESDAVPIPPNAVLEGGGQGDSHLLVVDRDACRLYELYAARRTGPQQWEAGSGAIFDLRSNALRPEGWTSADAAGLPIFPGLARYAELEGGHIAHALRFTTPRTRRAFTWPARRYAASTTDASLPPMGQRFRLRGSFDLQPFGMETRVFLTALQEYGMMLSDNGGPWFITGAPDSRWSSTLIRELRRIQGSDFEAVDVSSLMVDRNSAEARQ